MRFGRTSAGRRQREPGCFEHQIRSNKGFDVQDTRTKTDAYLPLHANKRHACLHAYIRTYHMHTYLHTNVQKHIRACTYLTTYIHRLHKYTYITSIRMYLLIHVCAHVPGVSTRCAAKRRRRDTVSLKPVSTPKQTANAGFLLSASSFGVAGAWEPRGQFVNRRHWGE